MTITSLLFALFVLLTVGVYYLLPVKKYQWTVLLTASCVFYALNSLHYVLFILFTTASVFFAGLKIYDVERYSKEHIRTHKDEWDVSRRKSYKRKVEKERKRITAIVLIANFGILFFLKYFNATAIGLMSLVGVEAPETLTKFVLPLGISFYTFQATGYLIDVYRDNIVPERNFFKFLLFVSYFPQIVQGPISSFSQLGNQFFEEHRPAWERFKLGGELVLWGLFKKMIIADRAVTAIDMVCGDYVSYSGGIILFSAVLYALQLYADFSGGIDIIRGVSCTFGIDLEVNFRQPYFSKTLNEYWRRWHITLGEWMKKYVFYSLAVSESFICMSKKIASSKIGKSSIGRHISKTVPSALATVIVFLLIGIWHGANTKYIGFGLWNGLVIMTATLLEPLFTKLTKVLHINTKVLAWRIFQIGRTFLLVLVGYYFDIAPNFRGAINMIKKSLTDNSLHVSFKQLAEVGIHRSDCLVLFYGLIVMAYFGVRLEKTGLSTPGELLEKRRGYVQWVTIFTCVISILLFGIYGPGFDASDFVYMGF